MPADSIASYDVHIDPRLIEFLRESNRIEGINEPPEDKVILLTSNLLARRTLTVRAVNYFQGIITPGMPLRDQPGMDVQVGRYIAPPGGIDIPKQLRYIIETVNKSDNPWWSHFLFESLHPYIDGNGRTGRLVWAWHMKHLGRDPFIRPFLHTFYYQTLEKVRSIVPSLEMDHPK